MNEFFHKIVIRPRNRVQKIRNLTPGGQVINFSNYINGKTFTSLFCFSGFFNTLVDIFYYFYLNKRYELWYT